MWRRCLLTGMLVWLAATPASAFVAYVSNEKGNTVTVIDTNSWTVTKTIKVGQRPRGIEFSRDGKFVMVAVGDDDTIQVIDTKTQEIVDAGHRDRSREARPARRHPGRRRARGYDDQPGRQDPDQHL